MCHCDAIFYKILKLVPRHEFETLAKQHHSGRSFRTASRWSQFVTRLKANAQHRVINRQPVLKNKGLTSDQTIRLSD